jgi:hypothetical protein
MKRVSKCGTIVTNLNTFGNNKIVVFFWHNMYLYLFIFIYMYNVYYVYLCLFIHVHCWQICYDWWGLKIKCLNDYCGFFSPNAIYYSSSVAKGYVCLLSSLLWIVIIDWWRCMSVRYLVIVVLHQVSNLYCHHWASVHPLTFHILINSSEATEPIWTKLWWNGPWMAPFQKCVRWSRLPTKMATKLKIEKRGYEILIVHCCFSISQNELKF